MSILVIVYLCPSTWPLIGPTDVHRCLLQCITAAPYSKKTSALMTLASVLSDPHNAAKCRESNTEAGSNTY